LSPRLRHFGTPHFRYFQRANGIGADRNSIATRVRHPALFLRCWKLAALDV
jgi:hypothetical protein